MMKYLFLLLALIFIGFSCEDGKIVEEDCTINNCNGHQECSNNKCVLLDNRCNKNTDCVPGFECNNQNFCINPADYCDSISCSNAGNCIIENDAPKCVCDSGYHAKALECVLDDPCSLVSCQEYSMCVVEGNKGVCHCQGGYHDEGGVCIIDDNNPCKLKNCQDGASCRVKEGVAICECNENYHPEGEACTNNQKLINCDSSSIPNNSTPTIIEVEITWNSETNSWEDTPKCEWQCDVDFHLEGEVCISNTKTVNCDSSSIPNDSTATIVEVEITWNSETNSWSEPIACEWNCNEGTHEVENLCIDNTDKANCNVENIPQNSTAIVVEVDIVWNSETNSWSQPDDCEWDCILNYHEENNSCLSNTKSINCNDNAPDNAVSSITELTITWNTETNSWEEPTDCNWNCKQNYIREEDHCILSTKMENCNDNAPNNATSEIAQVEVNWNTETNSWEEPAYCNWNCNPNFHTEDDTTCISNTKNVNCNDNAPNNATSEIAQVEVNWNTETNSWEEPAYCNWNCNPNFHTEDDTTCISNTKNINCNDNAPNNATSEIAEVEVNWNTQTNSWEEPADCNWNCNSPFIKEGDQCVEVACADSITSQNNNFDKDNAYLLELTDSVTEYDNLNTSNIIDGTCSKQDDWYVVSLSEGDNIIVDLLFTDADGDIDMHFYLGASSVAYSGSVTDNESATYTIKATDIPDGQNSVDLYIKVYSFGTANDYNMIVKVGESCTGNSDCVSDLYCNFGQCNYDLSGVNTCTDSSIYTINSSGLLGGTTENETNSYDLGSGSCANYTESGNDTVYKIYLNSGDQLDLTLHKTSTISKDISMYILTDCSNDVGSCVAGADDTFSNTDETLSYSATTSGYYYIIVDAYSDGFYEYELTVNLN